MSEQPALPDWYHQLGDLEYPEDFAEQFLAIFDQDRHSGEPGTVPAPRGLGETGMMGTMVSDEIS